MKARNEIRDDLNSGKSEHQIRNEKGQYISGMVKDINRDLDDHRKQTLKSLRVEHANSGGENPGILSKIKDFGKKHWKGIGAALLIGGLTGGIGGALLGGAKATVGAAIGGTLNHLNQANAQKKRRESGHLGKEYANAIGKAMKSRLSGGSVFDTVGKHVNAKPGADSIKERLSGNSAFSSIGKSLGSTMKGYGKDIGVGAATKGILHHTFGNLLGGD
jgi:hypothetical protein